MPTLTALERVRLASRLWKRSSAALLALAHRRILESRAAIEKSKALMRPADPDERLGSAEDDGVSASVDGFDHHLRNRVGDLPVTTPVKPATARAT